VFVSHEECVGSTKKSKTNMMSVTVAAATSFAAGSYLSRPPRRSFSVALRSDVSTTPTRILTELKRQCATPLPLLQQVAKAMSDDMRAGLGLGLGLEPGLPMIPTYVENLPTGYVMLCYVPFLSGLPYSSRF